MSFTLYGAPGTGSVCVETVLELIGAGFRFVPASPFEDGEEVARLKAVNPLLQVPALELPDGTIMTESAAILLYLTETYPDAGLAPAPGTAERAVFLRWLTFLAANFYSTYAISDKPGRFYEDPSGHDMLVRGALARRRALWQLMEAQVEPAPYLCGANMNVLDIYTAMMSHWSPGRAWFKANCPVLAQSVARTEAHDVVARVFARNFDD
ncbi:MAG: glutathione S-transferase [Maricaulis sp.]|jgi:GST-like protein|nr:glutathione S-transferase [Maricaulis sp.]MAL11647.1 glutathione S-transferase [Maricaulis sp.]